MATTNYKSNAVAAIFSILLLMYFNPRAQAADNSAFERAMQHIQQGNWVAAEALLEYQLAQKPLQHRVRLELAMVKMQLNELEQAREHLQTLSMVKRLPANVQFNIGMMLKQVDEMELSQNANDKNKVHAWRFNLTYALGYDDNVRYSFGDYYLEDDPYVDGFYIELDSQLYFFAPDGYLYGPNGEIRRPAEFGIELGAPNQNTGFIESSFMANHTFTGQNFSWNNELLIKNSDNKDFSDYDKALIKLNSEVFWPLAEDKELSLALEYRSQYRGGHSLLKGKSLKLQYSWFTAWGEWDLYSQYMERKFEDSEITSGDLTTYFPGFDNKTWSAGIDWSKLHFGNRLLTKVNVEYKYNKASDGLKYDGVSSKVAFVYLLSDNWSWAAYVNHFHQSYKQSHHVYASVTDKSFRIGTKLDYQVTDNWSVFTTLDKGIRESEVYGVIRSDTIRAKVGVEFNF